MKQTIVHTLCSFGVLLFLFSCNDSLLKPAVEPVEGLNIQIGSSILFTSQDIECYDHSSRYFYFKKPFGEWFRDYRYSKYWITSDGVVIDEGTFSDNGACYFTDDSLLIYDPFNFPAFVLKRGNIWYHNAMDTIVPNDTDQQVLLNELKELGIFCHGLECMVHEVKLSGVNEVVVSYSITNKDPWGYYFLDPDKIPIHHISNLDRHLSFNNFEKKTVHYAIPYYDSTWINHGPWDTEWLTLIEPGESQQYATRYQLKSESDPISTGNYWMRMIVPGLTIQLNKPEQRFLEHGRIWLGEMELIIKIELK
jgi:hypothetical protein